MNAEPEPAEVIAVLDLIDFTCGPGGFSLRGKKRERALDRMARDLTERGEPFILRGVRYGPERAAGLSHPPTNEGD